MPKVIVANPVDIHFSGFGEIRHGDITNNGIDHHCGAGGGNDSGEVVHGHDI